MTERNAVQGPGTVRSLSQRILPPMILGSGFVGIWYFIAYGVLEPRRRFLLRPPHEVIQVGFLEWDNFSLILNSLWSSTKVAMIGLSIAILIGFVLAITMSQAKFAELCGQVSQNLRGSHA